LVPLYEEIPGNSAKSAGRLQNQPSPVQDSHIREQSSKHDRMNPDNRDEDDGDSGSLGSWFGWAY
jgi:hypothetical protein